MATRLFFGLLLLLAAASCRESAAPEPTPDNVYYTCSMDPQVMEKKTGTCPICKMDLVRVEIDPNQRAGVLKLSEQQIRLANIRTDTVRSRLLGDEITLAATLRENQEHIQTLTVRAPGRIERLWVRNPGEPVRRGQAVFELYSEQLAAAQQDYLLALQSKQRFAATDPSFARLADAARNKLLLWGMSVEQLLELEQSGQVRTTLTFYSPYAGISTEVRVAEGDYVSEGSLVLRVADLRSLWVEAQLYVSDLPFLSRTDKALVEIPAFPDRVLQGRIGFVNPSLEGDSKIVLTRVEIPNPGGDLRPGMQAWITLKGKTHQALAVPANALIRGKDGVMAWVQHPDGSFESRMVTTGQTNRDATEITRGLQAGDVVVISGAYLLYSEQVFKKGVDPMAGHQH